MEIDWRFEPSGDFRSYDLGILGPRLEAEAKRMEHQNPLRRVVRSTGRAYRNSHECREQDGHDRCGNSPSPEGRSSVAHSLPSLPQLEHCRACACKGIGTRLRWAVFAQEKGVRSFR